MQNNGSCSDAAEFCTTGRQVLLALASYVRAQHRLDTGPSQLSTEEGSRRLEELAELFVTSEDSTPSTRIRQVGAYTRAQSYILNLDSLDDSSVTTIRGSPATSCWRPVFSVGSCERRFH